MMNVVPRQTPAYQGSSIFRLGDAEPALDPSAWIAPTAAIIGDVRIGAESGVWFHCVLRGDANFIQIGKRTNIQDGTVVHVDPGEFATVIGDDVTIGHACIIHGCRLEDQAFVGMGAIVMNGAVIERGGVLGAGALLTTGRKIGPGELWTGTPAKLQRVLTEQEREEFVTNASHYVGNAARFRSALARIRS
ncbi:gamma carbonic anhydrase family protein [Bradyrhizobium sp. Arg237L]|uniref:gamma carbonic anhydrase family protein n=1 Tax=Bradyrhizobium sp. Arg237L TaxID=3003352 RepID=UPI00249F6070|nr:gamma carbonic anhydrase family protein [Bradyrhizobium sp. Arg237L]MDI4237127.1 gamma carbonic anhydrase family protein [Bradyrhizobium sp. Arg237L]